MSITKEFFGKLSDGREVFRYLMRNERGMAVAILDFGGAIQQLLVPDRNGVLADVVGGYDDIYHYEFGDGYQGALIGRFGNRICRGELDVDGRHYDLFINNNGQHLHGGKVGFSHKIWDVEAIDGAEPRLCLQYTSPDGEENYPGTLHVSVTYTLSADNALSIRYEATTDKKTVLNLTNHAYFNLGGFASGKIFDHELWIDADTYLATDENLIPTGELIDVTDTPFDFRTQKSIGRDFGAQNEDLARAGGYDHCFNFNGGVSDAPKLRARLFDPNSGREMRVLTNQPCVQCYTANFLNNGAHPFKGGYPQGLQNAVCLETQHMPDSMHHENFTNVFLSPGEVYDFTTIYAFSSK